MTMSPLHCCVFSHGSSACRSWLCYLRELLAMLIPCVHCSWGRLQHVPQRTSAMLSQLPANTITQHLRLNQFSLNGTTALWSPPLKPDLAGLQNRFAKAYAHVYLLQHLSQ